MNETQGLQQEMWHSARIWQMFAICLVFAGLLVCADVQSVFAGEIIIVKDEVADVTDNSVIDLAHPFEISGGSLASPNTFTLDDDDYLANSRTAGASETTISGLGTGTYTIVELGDQSNSGDNFPWILTAINCVDSGGNAKTMSFIPGNSPIFTPNAKFPKSGGQFGHNGVNVTLDNPDETVTCTFTNTHHDVYDHGGVTIEKICDSCTEPFFWFDFSNSVGKTDEFIVVPNGTGRTLDFLSAPKTSSGAPPSTYTITEDPPTGWKVTDIVCEGEGMSASQFNIDISNGSVAIDFYHKQDPTCTFTNEPTTAVMLANFDVGIDSIGTTVAWTTAAEIDNAGFNVYGGPTAVGPWTKLNTELVPAKGGLAESASYHFVDSSGATFYMLEDIDTSGISTRHGPASIGSRTANASTNSFLLFFPLLQQPF